MTESDKITSADSGGYAFAAIFDLDGTLLDTEGCYTRFYDKVGKDFFGEDGFGAKVKGMTLDGMEKRFFEGRADDFKMVVRDLLELERGMDYGYIDGAEAMLREFRRQGVPMALVSSSSVLKMEQVYRRLPEFRNYFECVLTGEAVRRPKPAPDGFMQAMKTLGTRPERTIVFEDSKVGLRAARASGAFVVGLATTLPRPDVEREADLVITSYNGWNAKRFNDLIATRA